MSVNPSERAKGPISVQFLRLAPVLVDSGLQNQPISSPNGLIEGYSRSRSDLGDRSCGFRGCGTTCGKPPSGPAGHPFRVLERSGSTAAVSASLRFPPPRVDTPLRTARTPNPGSFSRATGINVERAGMAPPRGPRLRCDPEAPPLIGDASRSRNRLNDNAAALQECDRVRDSSCHENTLFTREFGPDQED